MLAEQFKTNEWKKACVLNGEESRVHCLGIYCKEAGWRGGETNYTDKLCLHKAD